MEKKSKFFCALIMSAIWKDEQFILFNKDLLGIH